MSNSGSPLRRQESTLAPIVKTLSDVYASDQSKADALVQLALIVDVSFGEEAAALCELLRKQRVLDRVVELIDHYEPLIHQTALLLLGNLSTDSVDPKSEDTKKHFKEINGFSRLIPHLFSDQALTVAYALGAIQNTCTDIEYVAHMQQAGAIVRLQDLIQCDQPQIVNYAEAVLHNVMETVMTISRELQITKAAVKIQSAQRRRIAVAFAHGLRLERDEQEAARVALIEAEIEKQLAAVGRPEDYDDPMAFARATKMRKAQKELLMKQMITFDGQARCPTRHRRHRTPPPPPPAPNPLPARPRTSAERCPPARRGRPPSRALGVHDPPGGAGAHPPPRAIGACAGLCAAARVTPRNASLCASGDGALSGGERVGGGACRGGGAGGGGRGSGAVGARHAAGAHRG
eukprot:1403830-Prymnesium_polylepis.1